MRKPMRIKIEMRVNALTEYIHTLCVYFSQSKCGMPSFYRWRQTHWKPIVQMRSEAKWNEHTQSWTGWKQLISKTNHSKSIFNIIFTDSHRSMQINKLIQLRIECWFHFTNTLASKTETWLTYRNRIPFKGIGFAFGKWFFLVENTLEFHQQPCSYQTINRLDTMPNAIDFFLYFSSTLSPFISTEVQFHCNRSILLLFLGFQHIW